VTRRSIAVWKWGTVVLRSVCESCRPFVITTTTNRIIANPIVPYSSCFTRQLLDHADNGLSRILAERSWPNPTLSNRASRTRQGMAIDVAGSLRFQVIPTAANQRASD